MYTDVRTRTIRKRLQETVAASVTKEDAATYVVVYSRVFVRDYPSIDGKYVGRLLASRTHQTQPISWY